MEPSEEHRARLRGDRFALEGDAYAFPRRGSSALKHGRGVCPVVGRAPAFAGSRNQPRAPGASRLGSVVSGRHPLLTPAFAAGSCRCGHIDVTAHPRVHSRAFCDARFFSCPLRFGDRYSLRVRLAPASKSFTRVGFGVLSETEPRRAPARAARPGTGKPWADACVHAGDNGACVQVRSGEARTDFSGAARRSRTTGAAPNGSIV